MLLALCARPARGAGYDWETDSDLRDKVDFEVPTLGVEFQATDTVKLEAEIEVEHLGTGSTMEFDKFEEIGEFETEVERGGEVELEELVIEYEPYDIIGAKVGYFPIPIGFNAFRHRPGQTRCCSTTAARADSSKKSRHGGEAEASREAFRSMSADDRAALVRFLESL